MNAMQYEPVRMFGQNRRRLRGGGRTATQQPNAGSQGISRVELQRTKRLIGRVGRLPALSVAERVDERFWCREAAVIDLHRDTGSPAA
jgi:hypothetical protein